MSETTKKTEGFGLKGMLINLLVILGLLSGLYYSVNENLNLWEKQKNSSEEKENLVKSANLAFESNNKANLKLLMQPFVWAVRGELTRGNNEQVDVYFKQLVQNDRIEEISFIDSVGVVMISTNKKYEGKTINADFVSTMLKADEITIVNKMNKRIIGAPVLSIDRKIGTLILIYRSEPFQLEEEINLVKEI